MLLGRLKRVVIHVDVVPVDEQIIGNYFEDEAFRQQFQLWLNQRWVNKDQKIAAYMAEHTPTKPTLVSHEGSL